MRQKVIILGATGMLGSMILDVLAKDDSIQVIATTRKNDEKLKKNYPEVEFRTLDAESADLEQLAEVLQGASWVINAIGIINTYIHENNGEEIERAIKVNSFFPHLLSKAAKNVGAEVIQIATDCVFKCDEGGYSEQSPHDAADVYGQTKSLGEAYYDNMHHLRCSIIGPEKSAHLSLMDWFLTQPKGASVNGFNNHYWNGITTLQFAKICLGIIQKNIQLDHLQHVIPSGQLTKLELIQIFAEYYKREDIKITPLNTQYKINRVLVTDNTGLNQAIWEAAGYKQIPTIKEMILELSKYKFKENK